LPIVERSPQENVKIGRRNVDDSSGKPTDEKTLYWN